MEKRIYRSKDNRMFSGVCGGLGEYFDIDPTIIRLLAVFAILSSCFTGLIAYFVCAMVIPQRPIGTPYATSGHSEQPSQYDNKDQSNQQDQQNQQEQKNQQDEQQSQKTNETNETNDEELK